MVTYQSVMQVQKLISKRIHLFRQLRNCSSEEVEMVRKEIQKVEEELKRLGAVVSL